MSGVGTFAKSVILGTEKINFNDKVAIITGAGKGLGKSYAIQLSKRGARVVVNDIDDSSNIGNIGILNHADEVVHEIRNKGGIAVANYDDVSSVQGGINIVKTALDNFGTIDILINNAGILSDRSFAKMTPDEWESVLNIHLNGAYNVTCPTFNIMKHAKYGKIIFTTSAAGLYGNFGQANYAAAKMGLVGMMNSLKLEGKKYNINVNTIAPIAASRLTKDVMPVDIFDKAKPDLVASLVLYLCSEYCLDTGGLYNVGMGYVNRVVISTSNWTKISRNTTDCTPEEIHKRWLDIKDMRGAKEFEDLSSLFLDLMPFLEK